MFINLIFRSKVLNESESEDIIIFIQGEKLVKQIFNYNLSSFIFN